MPNRFTEVKAVIKLTDIIWGSVGAAEGIQSHKTSKDIYTFNSLRKFIRWKNGHRSQPATGIRAVGAPT